MRIGRSGPFGNLIGATRLTPRKAFPAVAAAATLLSFALAAPAAAQDASAPSGAAAAQVAVELNKLEPIENGCRIYVVVNNQSQSAFETLKLDLVLFRTDGIVDQRFFVDLAPLRKDKRIVKLFEIDKLKCDEIGSFLVNDVVECRSDGQVANDCLSRLSISSLANAKLSK